MSLIGAESVAGLLEYNKPKRACGFCATEAVRCLGVSVCAHKHTVTDSVSVRICKINVNVTDARPLHRVVVTELTRV